MNDTVQLCTERLLLRPLIETDAQAVETIASDPRVALTTSSIPHPYPQGAAAEFIAQKQRLAGPAARTFGVTLGREEPLLGYNSADGVAEIRYMISARHWGRGYATEAAGALLRHLVVDLGFRSVVATVMASKHASILVRRKLGFAKQWQAELDIPLRGSQYLVSGWRLDNSRAFGRDRSGNPQPGPAALPGRIR